MKRSGHGPPAGAATASLAIIVLGTAIAIGAHALLGFPGLTAASRATAPLPDPRQAQIGTLVAEIERRPQARPEDGEAWAALARTRALQRRHGEAIAAFERAVALLPADAALLADFAESAVRAAGGRFEARTVGLLEQALALDPAQLKAVALLGAARFRLGEPERARGHLQQVLAALPPGSNDARHIEAMLAAIDAGPAARSADEPGLARP